MKIYIHNFNYKLYELYYPNGKIQYKCAIFREKPLGPIEFYDSNGILELYNERDFAGEIYYIKKYDKQKVIKEEGMALSHVIFDVSLCKRKDLMFFYAKPKGYENRISVALDGEKVDYFDFPEHHIGLIVIDSLQVFGKSHEIKVQATLLKNGETVDSKEITKIIQP